MIRPLLILGLVQLSASQLRWENISAVSGPIPEARRDSSIGYDIQNKTLIIFGGRGSSGTFDDTWIFDIQCKTWENVKPSSPPEARFSMVYGCTKDHFYISTGEKSGKFFDDIHRFSIAKRQWEELKPKGTLKPEKRYGSGGGIWRDVTAGKDGDGFYVTHGFKKGLRYSNTLKYDFAKTEWQEKFGGTNSYNPKYPHGRCLHAATMTDKDELVMYGGCLGGGKTGGSCPAQDSWKFDAIKSKWSRLNDCASPRTYPGMAMLPFSSSKKTRVAVLYGGDEESKSVLAVSKAAANEIAVLNLETSEWTRKKIKGTAPAKRFGHVMATTEAGIVVFGGREDGGPFSNEVWLLKGDADQVDKTPSTGCNSSYFNLIALHGIFMFIGWGVLLQAGAFIGRYFRHRDPWWFKMHQILQVSGLIASVIGFACAIASVPFDHLKFAHGQIGLIIMIVGLLQPLNAVFRPHKNKDGPQELKRIIWEWLHKLSGRFALLFALINIALGLFLAVAPVAAWAVWFALFVTFVLVYVIMEVRLQMKNRKTENASYSMDKR